MNDEFENALTWFQAAPSSWLKSAKQDLNACAEWIWGVLQGDFNEDATTAQTVTSTVISMIPFVDQICDVRDVVANCKRINAEPKETWHWVGLALTLIGLFPTLGSLVKGCGKVMFASIRKASHASGTAKATSVAIDAAIRNLNTFLARPEVRKTLKALKIDNPYKYLSKKVRELSAQVNTAKLLQAFDVAKDAADGMLSLVKKWGSQALATRAGSLVTLIAQVRKQADQMLGKALRPVQDILDKLANRLNVEADMMHRSHLNQVNPHAWKGTSEAEELAVFEKQKPDWVDRGAERYKALRKYTHVPGWPDLSENAPWFLKNKFNTFHKVEAVSYPPGTKLYRVIAPNSMDNSICWMTESEFKALKTKADWRRRFAVWASWNNNGEYVTYTVPPGPGLRAWRGPAASQTMAKSDYVLEGGAEQIVLDPREIQAEYLGRRQPTNWGYSNFGEKISLTGVPVLSNNFKDYAK
jgi:hypothetical protein